jgi:hypothetical protein
MQLLCTQAAYACKLSTMQQTLVLCCCDGNACQQAEGKSSRPFGASEHLQSTCRAAPSIPLVNQQDGLPHGRQPVLAQPWQHILLSSPKHAHGMPIQCAVHPAWCVLLNYERQSMFDVSSFAKHQSLGCQEPTLKSSHTMRCLTIESKLHLCCLP